MKADVALGPLDRARSVLVVVDAQARLAPAIDGGEGAIGRIRLLLIAAGRLGVPAIVTEQHPAGLGPTVAALRPALAGMAEPPVVVAKTSFSAWAEPTFRAALAAARRDEIVLCGFEAHVCVLQTALALAGAGHRTAIVADAVGSRDPANRALALERCRANGILVVSAEMVAFEWLGRAGTPEFRDLLGEIK